MLVNHLQVMGWSSKWPQKMLASWWWLASWEGWLASQYRRNLWYTPYPLTVTTRIITFCGSGIPINLDLPLLLGAGGVVPNYTTCWIVGFCWGVDFVDPNDEPWDDPWKLFITNLVGSNVLWEHMLAFPRKLGSVVSQWVITPIYPIDK